LSGHPPRDGPSRRRRPAEREFAQKLAWACPTIDIVELAKNYLGTVIDLPLEVSVVE